MKFENTETNFRELYFKIDMNIASINFSILF